MLRTSRATLLIGIAVSGALLSACAQAGTHPLVLLLGVVLVIPLARVAGRAGAPIPCSGYEVRSCVDGRILDQCCPQGAKCNFENRPFTDCGAALCTERDRGHCPDPVAHFAPPGSCGDAWDLACIGGVVEKACIPPVPTNYMGPPQNPRFTTCGEGPGVTSPAVGMACTTNALPERCYPAKVGAKVPPIAVLPDKPGVPSQKGAAPRQIPARACGVVPWGGYAGITAKWTEVCLDGQVVERCLPTRKAGARFESTLFTKVDGGRCVIKSAP